MTVRIRQYTKRGKTGWEVDIRLRLPDGTEIRERKKAPVTSKSGAKFWGEQREAELLRNSMKTNPKPNEAQTQQEQPKPQPQAPTLAEFFPRTIEGYAKANRQKPSTVESKESIFKNHLGPKLGLKRLNELTDEDVQRLKASLQDRGAKTVNNVLSALSKTLKLAVRWKVIPLMPVQIEFLKSDDPEVSFYEFEQYAALVEAAEKVGTDALVAVLLGGDAGLRSGEMLSLDWTDVDFRRSQLNVRKADWKEHTDLPTKGNRARKVPMTQKLAQALSAHRHLRGRRVLCQEDGAPLSEQNLRTLIARAQRRAGLPDNGNKHVLRHTFCSHLAMRGATMLAIKELAGHRSLRTTMRYMHLSPSHKDEAIALLDKARDAGSPGDPQNFGDILETGEGTN